mmetsp:Transcript_123514/g.395077  ORF Transcript_123514/g.395077 Transcript_123514/m.395077 type:complete len:217 (+) Transcript_123514:2370-3020(+)
MSPPQLLGPAAQLGSGSFQLLASLTPAMHYLWTLPCVWLPWPAAATSGHRQRLAEALRDGAGGRGGVLGTAWRGRTSPWGRRHDGGSEASAGPLLAVQEHELLLEALEALQPVEVRAPRGPLLELVVSVLELLVSKRQLGELGSDRSQLTKLLALELLFGLHPQHLVFVLALHLCHLCSRKCQLRLHSGRALNLRGPVRGKEVATGAGDDARDCAR